MECNRNSQNKSQQMNGLQAGTMNQISKPCCHVEYVPNPLGINYNNALQVNGKLLIICSFWIEDEENFIVAEAQIVKQ